MATEFKLPELGENIETANILSVLVKPGDRIEIDQSIIEIETDKATVEVPSSVSGEVKDVKIKAGDTVKVGQVMLTVEESVSVHEKMQKPEEVKDEKETDKVQPVKTKPEEKKAGQSSEKLLEEKSHALKNIIDIKLPELGENIDSANVLSVVVKKGNYIEKDQSILEIETDKATIEVPSPVPGKVVDVIIKNGEQAKVGQILMKVETTNYAGTKQEIIHEVLPDKKNDKSDLKSVEKKNDILLGKLETVGRTEMNVQPPITKGAAPAAPSVRRLAREIGVDINKVSGSGPYGRISVDDVKTFAKKLNESKESIGLAVGITQEVLPDFSKFGEVERKSMSNIRVKTAVHLGYAWSSIPHVTQHDTADIGELEKFRKAYNSKVEKTGGKLTITAILLKVIASALKVFPQFNSSIDMEKKEIIYKKYFHIGIAVDTEHGLIVPVIRNVDKKNIAELSVEMNTIAGKARTRKISLDELQGGSFTITNLGGIGGTSFTPIVNSPEVAVLGVSRGSYESIYKDGNFVPGLMLPLSLSYDHRIIDGADAARFLRWVCEALEQPVKILIEG